LHACEIEWHVTGEFDFEQRRKNCLVSARGKRLGLAAGIRFGLVTRRRIR